MGIPKKTLDGREIQSWEIYLSYNLRWLTIFLSITLLVAYFFGAIVPEVRAWNFSITPTMNVAWPGHPAIYDISVFLDPQEIWGPWTIKLLVSPPELGVTVTFSTNDQAPPFTSTMTVEVDDSKPAGIYTLGVWAHPSYALFPGPDNEEIAVKLNVAMRTDFALSSPSLSPPAPKTGDSVTFSVVLTALSSTIPFTQKLSEMAKASLDGTQISVESLNYLGPTGTPMTVSTATPWTATEGAHTITWSLIIMYDDPDLVLIDPDSSNNKVSLSFSVSSSPPPVIEDFSIDASPPSLTINQGGASRLTITVHSKMGFSVAVTFATSWVGASPTEVSAPAPRPVTPVPDGTGTTVLTVTAGPSASVGSFTLRVTGTSGSFTHSADISVTISAAVTPTSTPTSTPTPSPTLTPTPTPTPTYIGLPETVFIAITVIILIAIAMRHRRKRPVPAAHTATPPPPAIKYCYQCGTALSKGVKYCTKCGARQE
nr:zinc ribbon domain-containing protein [Candidatus Njordarchaeum guaymaensis]